VRIPDGALDRSMADRLLTAFEVEYRRLYGRTAEGNPVEAINWRLVAAAPTPHLPLDRLAHGATMDNSQPLKGTRRAFVQESGAFAEVPVYDRYAFAPGFSLTGPAIIEENESTIVIGLDAQVHVDSFANVVIQLPNSVA
jgi:N-methylhydantoinase A